MSGVVCALEMCSSIIFIGSFSSSSSSLLHHHHCLLLLLFVLHVFYSTPNPGPTDKEEHVSAKYGV